MFYSFALLLFILIIIYIYYKKKLSNLSYCCICEQVFKENQIFNRQELTFCKEHIVDFDNNEWKIYQSVCASSKNSIDAMKIYDLKQQLSLDGKLCFIKTSYEEIDQEIHSKFDLYIIKKGS